MNSNNGLIIFAREPLPGQVKSRLAASIGDRAAAGWYDVMLRAVLETGQRLRDVDVVVYWACEEKSLELLAERYGCRSRRQCPGTLGQRMQAAFAEMFTNGCDNSCIIGSDAPDLPLSYLQAAFEKLTAGHADVVFGPAMDGGYYLLGMRQLWPQLFNNIAWSTSDVLEQSLSAAKCADVTVDLLPHWCDIDTLEDLQAFQKRQQMAHDPATGIT